MKKIEKLEGSYDVPQLKQKLNEIIDYLNTQPQTEDWRNITVGQLMEDRKKTREFLQNNPDFLKECEPKVKTATGVAMDFKPQDTPEEWVEKLWKLIDVYRDSKDINSELERIEEVNQYVKQLLSEREREVLETIKELVDGKSIYSNNGCGTPLELIEWFVDTELDKLNKKK